MKSKVIFSSLLSAAFLLVSCKKEEEAVTTSGDKPKEIIMPRVQTIPNQTAPMQPVTQNVTPMQSAQPVTTGQPVTLNPAPVTTKPGMNPPHGQPGHRCDIAVGAPLNSPAKPAVKAGSGTTQQINPATITTTTTTQPSGAPAILSTESGSGTTTTAPGMNPPHGQDGHRCDIAVGAPLPKS